MFHLTIHSTHFIYGYMVSHMIKDHSDSEREKTCCCHMGYSFRLAARVLLYAPSHRQDSTYHGLCYTSRGALAGTRSRNGHKYKDRNVDVDKIRLTVHELHVQGVCAPVVYLLCCGQVLLRRRGEPSVELHIYRLLLGHVWQKK